MDNQIDVYYSFRSPYSYLASPDMLRLKQDYAVAVNLRVVLPIAVRSPGYFRPGNEKWARYIQLDWPRRAEFLGLPHEWPEPDPIAQDLGTLKVAEEQPYIFWLSKLAVEAQHRGRGVEFAFHVSRSIFGGTKNWNAAETMGASLKAAGLELTDMEDAIQSGDHLEEIERNQIELDKSGHWGVPTFVFQGEPFFGQDRVELLRWRLDKYGVEMR